jgi:hypothetical protein
MCFLLVFVFHLFLCALSCVDGISAPAVKSEEVNSKR